MGILDTIIHTKHSEALRTFEPEKIVEEILDALKEREKHILIKRYGLKGSEIKTLAAIGSEHNLTRERVRQIEKNLLKHLRKKSQTHESFDSARQILLEIIHEHGKIITEETLLRAIGVKNENERNAIIFILHLIEELESYLHENYKKCWTSVIFNKQILHEFAGEASALLERAGQPMQVADFLEQFKTTAFFKKHGTELDERKLLNYLDLVQKIGKNVYGEIGLRHWKQITPKDVGDKAYLVLKKHGKPEHYSTITQLINDAHFDNRRAYKETVHNELIKDSRFVLIGRGIYALSDWGYKNGTVVDVITEILRQAGRPLPKDKILEEVFKRRQVKRNTVLVGLSNKKLFKKVDRNLYTLA